MKSDSNHYRDFSWRCFVSVLAAKSTLWNIQTKNMKKRREQIFFECQKNGAIRCSFEEEIFVKLQNLFVDAILFVTKFSRYSENYAISCCKSKEKWKLENCYVGRIRSKYVSIIFGLTRANVKIITWKVRAFNFLIIACPNFLFTRFFVTVLRASNKTDG